jgi:hypothetical protein
MLKKIYFSRMQYGYKKNAEYDADFEYGEKVAERLVQKSSQQKSDRKMELLTICLGIPFYLHFRSGRLHFVKKSKSLYLNAHIHLSLRSARLGSPSPCSLPS